ncbi:wax ester/triacylglycerol synthase domain-containing protein [Streptomyces sp. NPDC051840]|uniref:wax ester/triacylglycerol synthase domain-containing protein n=1 Tax=Streptomyces sp. NPDC051840 TaxID=3154752 RepID=UPI0034221463
MSGFLRPSAADLFMRQADRLAEHPDANATIGAVLHVTGAVPEPADLREHLAERLPGLPCLTHVLSGDGTAARWVPAVPDLAHHVRAQMVDSGPGALETAVRILLREPWSEGRPAWRMILLHGHACDGFALLYLAHHAVQDGGSMAAVLEALFGPSLPPERLSAPARGLTSTGRPRPLQVLRTIRTLLRHVRRHHLWQSASQPLSSRRHTLWTQVPDTWLRIAAQAGGASTNDVYLTALTGAVTRWAEEAWPRASEGMLPVMVPVNLRTREEATAPGNRLFLTRIDLPSGTTPGGPRLARTREITAPLKCREHKTVLRAALTRLPPWLLRRLVAVSTAPGRLTVCASHLVMRHELHYGEAVVDRIDPVICCPPGAPMAVVMLSYQGVVSACFRVDQALPGSECLPALWNDALADLAGISAAAEPVVGSATPTP